jgi:hypothetical protein
LSNSLGVFLFIEASAIEPGYKAILESTVFQPTPTYGLCMDFWYHMYGQGKFQKFKMFLLIFLL